MPETTGAWNKAKRRFIAGLGLIGVSFLLCAALILYCRLDQPVFIENIVSSDVFFDETGAGGTADFTLEYIANADDRRRVLSVTFPEAEKKGVVFSVQSATVLASGSVFENLAGTGEGSPALFGRYALHTVAVTAGVPSGSAFEGLTLRRAMVTYSNGDMQEAAVGMIELYGNSTEQGPLASNYSSSSSDGTSKERLTVDEDITIQGLEFCPDYPPAISDWITIRINGRDPKQAAGMRISRGENLELDARVPAPSVIRADIRPVLRYTDAQGREYSRRIYNIHSSPYFSGFWDMARYLRSKAAL